MKVFSTRFRSTMKLGCVAALAMTLIETHSLTAQAPEAFPAALPVAGVQSAGITHQVEPNSVITTMDVPATNGRSS